MDFYINSKAIEGKLGTLLAKDNLLYDFKTNTYPVTLTITQNRSPEAQMEIFDTNDGAVSSCDAVLRFVFDLDGVTIQTNDRLVIAADKLNKIKGMAIKLFHAYIEGYYAERRNPEKLRQHGDPDLSPEQPTEDAVEEDAAADSAEDFADFFDDAAEDEQ